MVHAWRYNATDPLSVCTQIVQHLVGEVGTENIMFNWPASHVEYGDVDALSRVIVRNSHGGAITGCGVVVAVPAAVLKSDDITFTPPLPPIKRAAIDSLTMLGAVKVSHISHITNPLCTLCRNQYHGAQCVTL